MPAPDRTPYELALRQWLLDVLTPEYPSVQVVFSPNEGPIPAAPFATLSVDSFAPVGNAEVVMGATPVGTEPEAPEGNGGPLYPQTIRQAYEGVASVDVFGPAHRAMLATLDLSLADGVQASRNHGRGLTVQGSSAHIDGTDLRGASWRQRSRADYRFCCFLQATHGRPVVADARSTSRVNAPAPSEDTP